MRRGLIAGLAGVLVLGAADAALADRFTGYGSCDALEAERAAVADEGRSR